MEDIVYDKPITVYYPVEVNDGEYWFINNPCEPEFYISSDKSPEDAALAARQLEMPFDAVLEETHTFHHFKWEGNK